MFCLFAFLERFFLRSGTFRSRRNSHHPSIRHSRASLHVYRQSDGFDYNNVLCASGRRLQDALHDVLGGQRGRGFGRDQVIDYPGSDFEDQWCPKS